MTRKIIIGASIFLLVALLTFGIVFQGALRQDEDHLAVLRAVALLTVSSKNLVRVDRETFVQKAGAGDLPIITYLQDRGWMFVEQMGSGLFFERGKTRSLVVSRQYSRFFRLIDVSDMMLSD